jgi:UDP-glucuronate decarboxylase
LTFLRLMQSPSGFTGPVNLGNPGEFTMIELAEAVRDLTGSRSELAHQLLLADEPPLQRQPDIRLAREHLGWEPKVALREGLRPTIAYFEQLLSLGGLRRREMA